MITKNVQRQLSKIITVVFIGLFVWYGWANPELFRGLSGVGAVSILLVAVGRMLLYLSNGIFTKWSAEAFIPKMSLGEGFYLVVLSAIGNFFGPLLGGTSVRAVYLKKVHDLSYSKFTATLIGYYLLLFSANCVVALVAVWFLPRTSQTAPLLLFFGAWLIMLVAILTVRFSIWSRFVDRFKGKYVNFFLKILIDIEQGWHLIQNNKLLIRRLGLLAALAFVAEFFTAYIEFRAIGVSLSLPALGLYTVLVSVSLLISFTPAAIGIRETMLLLVSSTLGVTNQQILQVALIDRGVTFGLLFLLFMLTRSKRVKGLLALDKKIKI